MACSTGNEKVEGLHGSRKMLLPLAKEHKREVQPEAKSLTCFQVNLVHA